MLMCCQLLLALASIGGGLQPQPALSAQSLAPSGIARPLAAPLLHAWLDLEEPELDEQEVEKRRVTDPRQSPIDCALPPVASRVFCAQALKVARVAPMTKALHGAISIGLARGPPARRQ